MSKTKDDPDTLAILDRLEQVAAVLVDQGYSPALVGELMQSYGLATGIHEQGAERWRDYLYLAFLQVGQQAEVEKADKTASRH